MQKIPRAVLYVWAGVALSAGFHPPVHAAPENTLPLAGKWVLNEDLSSDFQSALKRSQRDAGAFRRRGPGDPGHFPGEGSESEGGGMAADGGRLLVANLLAPRFQIIQNDAALTFVYGPGRFRTVNTDRHSYTATASGSIAPDRVQTIASWGADKLYIESNTAGGLQLVETYRLSADGRRLTISTRFRTNAAAKFVDGDRVYDRADPPP